MPSSRMYRATLKQGRFTASSATTEAERRYFFRCICGFMRPSKGQILVHGEEVGKRRDFPDDLGIIIESPGFLLQYSGIKNLQILASLKKRITKADIEATMRRVGLDPASKKTVGKYSLGMRQRLGIAQAIMENPKLLILALRYIEWEALYGIVKQGDNRCSTRRHYSGPALGIEEPIYIKAIRFDKEAGELHIDLDFREGAQFKCSVCGAEDQPIYDTQDKTWRHLNFFQYKCYLHFRTPRTNCPECGVHLYTPQWGRKNSGFTMLFELLVLTLARSMPVCEIAELVGRTRYASVADHPALYLGRICAKGHEQRDEGRD